MNRFFGQVSARCVKKANGKYVVYREYQGDTKEVDDSALFLKVENCDRQNTLLQRQKTGYQMQVCFKESEIAIDEINIKEKGRAYYVEKT